MKSFRFWIPVVVSLLAMPFGLYRDVLDIFYATILFPYTNLWAVWINASFNGIANIMAIIQFPMYGIILGLANIKRKLLPVAAVLLTIHVLAAGAFCAPFYIWPLHHHDSVSRLLMAVSAGDVSTVKSLLDMGVDPNSNTDGLNVLSVACSEGQLEIAKLLIEKGADINSQQDIKFGGPALILAVESHNDEIVELLLSNGADVMIKDSHGFTALERAQMWHGFAVSTQGYNSDTERARGEKIISLLESAAKTREQP